MPNIYSLFFTVLLSPIACGVYLLSPEAVVRSEKKKQHDDTVVYKAIEGGS